MLFPWDCWPMKSRVSFSVVCFGVAVMAAAPLLARPPAPALEREVGPGGDYPVLIGDPFVVEGKTFTPADTMNYDAVGYTAPSEMDDALTSVSGAHRTLPVPSYVEVTSLDTGRTALVRLEKRGPMTGDTLIALSDAARSLIGIAPGARAAVRVRRVNPPEQERALLRTGQAAPLRMDTPPGLLTALRRKLGVAAVTEPVTAPAAPVKSVPVKNAAVKPPPPKKPVPVAVTKPIAPPQPTLPIPASPPPAAPEKAAAALPKAGGYYVQVGAYANKANAVAVAKRVGGNAVAAGKLWRVRIGQNAARPAADAALAKARGAGYADARILSDN
jgi:rare lipoprotein A